MTRSPKPETISTEIKIKEGAHKVFLANGYKATTIRQIAKETGTNVALVNYYFKSKKNLFNEVMLEKIGELLMVVGPILNDEATSLEQKVENLADSYIDFLSKNPELITFIMNEIRKQNFEFIAKSGFAKVIFQSCFVRQMKVHSGDINPVHFLISLAGMVAFPFVVKPMMLQTGLATDKQFQMLMTERKMLIPVWIKAMVATSSNQTDNK